MGQVMGNDNEKFTMKNARRVLGFLLGAAVFLSSGCSEKEGRPAVDKESVANVTHSTKEGLLDKRVLGRMEALIERDWKAAYEYLSPARRKLMPYPVFVNRMNISAILRKHVDVVKKDCNTDACDVLLKLRYIYIGGVVSGMQGQERSSTIHEKWVYMDGNWWFVPE
ncbi:hypothetical protein [Thiolapillus sp.]|nr:hypothetical protein [Thiolapillus sp.]